MSGTELVSSFDVGPGYDPTTPTMSTLREPEEWFLDAIGATASDSGERVSPRTAMTHVPVWQAVNILAGDVGQLPWHKMRRSGKNREKDRKHQLEMLVAKRPNDWQTPSSWKEMMMQWALLWGNAVCWIRGKGSNRRFVPLHPSYTTYEEPEPGEYWIVSRYNNKNVAIPYSNCFHIKGLADDGFWGLSAASVLKNAIGHGLALQKHGNTVFKNGGRPSGIVKFPLGVKKGETYSGARFREEWNRIHKYSGNVAVLWDGGDYSPIAMSNVDADWIEGRKLDRQMVASIFNLPSFKLNGSESSATRSNMEEQQRSYFTTSLSRWTNKFNEEAEKKLLTDQEQRSGEHFFRWFPEAFLKGDLASRSEAYSRGIQDRWLSPNEVREKEDMNPYEGGDEYLNPAIDTAERGDGEANEPNEAIENLLRDRVRAMLSAECSQVNREVKRQKNFTNWMSNFYENYTKFAEGFLAAAADVAKSQGISFDWKAKAIMHASNSREEMLKITDWATKENLSEAVHSHTEKLIGQVEDLIGDLRHG